MTTPVPDRGARGPVLSVSALAVDDDRLLLVRRGRGPAAGEWALPGGRVERGETLAEAVVRELLEETGLEGVCADLVGVNERVGEAEHHVVLAYRALLASGDDPVAGDDAAEARWVPLGDVAELRLVDGLAELLHDHGVFTAFT